MAKVYLAPRVYGLSFWDWVIPIGGIRETQVLALHAIHFGSEKHGLYLLLQPQVMNALRDHYEGTAYDLTKAKVRHREGVSSKTVLEFYPPQSESTGSELLVASC